MEAVQNKDIESKYLTKAKDRQIPMIIFTMRGFQIRGIITDFDDNVIQVESDGKEQIVYKHAVSTVAPVFPEEAIKRDARNMRGLEKDEQQTVGLPQSF